MVTQNSILFFLVSITSLFTISVAQVYERLRCDNDSANFTINGTYQRNLNDALSSLTSDTSIRYGFYNQSVGQIPNQVNTLALCRVDVQPNDCRSCINTASTRLRDACPNKQAAIGWYDNCMVRYSNVTILGTLDTRIIRWVANGNNVSNVAQYNQALDQLLDQLRSEASRGGSLRKYASNSTNGPSFTTIYGFMQCTPDLSATQFQKSNFHSVSFCNIILMVIQNSILFFLVSITSLLTISVAQVYERLRCDNDSANFTINGTYQRNLNDALSSLTSDTSIRYGFYNRSVGQIPNQVNTLALCRVDVQPNDCRSCINTASTRLRDACPNKQAAIGWYDNCMVRYSNVTILGALDTRITRWVANRNNVSNVAQYNQALDQLLDQLRSEASRGGSLRKYASNSTNGPSFTTIYGFMQCTPDLSATQCNNCLDLAIRYIPTCCDSKSSNTTIIVIAVVASVSLALLSVAFGIIFMRRKRKIHGRLLSENEDIEEISTAESLQYSFGIIREATDDFSENNKLGEGGFGLVYKQIVLCFTLTFHVATCNSFVFRHGKVGEMELHQL
ncbi:cysteine-rich receptor-like protein kinase 8 [Artemisia annua]|uniref:Cysteine-rich receptor-like protein kinase 8 n=1 Tax=Artemisia annua TaxID=35608 RepID=A0A2U1P0P7_ARTAN|nr:cysteine-rich receptor-like protein kinase 8 [Artemisia annua]